MVVYKMTQSKNPAAFSPLVLAYIGDAVYEKFTREKLLSLNPDMPAYKLHRENIKYVKAHAQSKSLAALEPILTEEETAVYKRGRNAKSGTTPKNADLIEYRRATGFEALLGYISLKKDEERLLRLMEIAFENALD